MVTVVAAVGVGMSQVRGCAAGRSRRGRLCLLSMRLERCDAQCGAPVGRVPCCNRRCCDQTYVWMVAGVVCEVALK